MRSFRQPRDSDLVGVRRLDRLITEALGAEAKRGEKLIDLATKS